MRRDRFAIDRPDGARIVGEALGEPGAPLLLLIGGATWSLDPWEDGLCEQLCEQRLRVVRYDQRDTGESTTYPPGKPGYGAADVIADALAIIGALGAERAHVAGLSMGGGIAQELGLAHRAHVASLTLISTTPIDPRISSLPGPDPGLFGDEPEQPGPSDREAVVERLVEDERPYAGPGNFDEARMRALAGRIFDRSSDLAARANHFLLTESTVEPDLDRLAGIPTLVVHGDADPLFPPEHGRALAAAIPGAELLILEDVGHQLPPPQTWPRLAAAIGELADRP